MAATDRRVYRRDRIVIWHHLDVSLVALVGLVTLIGAVTVFSATRGPATIAEPADLYYLQRQALFVVAGAALGTVAALVDYRQLRALVPLAYAGLITLLLGVLVVGKEVKGARAWFDLGPMQLQPAEVGKVVLIGALAAFFSSDETVSTSRLLRGLALVGAAGRADLPAAGPGNGDGLRRSDPGSGGGGGGLGLASSPASSSSC